MKITITVDCKDDEEAHEVINLLTRRHKTWLEYGDTHSSGTKLDQTSVDIKAALDATPIAQKNITPGFVACQKIGTETKELLLAALPSSDTEHIAKKIKRTNDQTCSFLQLMWDRSLIKFDGEEYYL